MRDSDNQPDADDDFAKALEAQHERLIAIKSDFDSTDMIEPSDDQRVLSAVEILRLLEQQVLHDSPVGTTSPPGFVDLSTKKTLETQRNVALSTSDTIEKILPDLERLGRFEIIEQIGRGGFGIVVRARDPQLDRDVAIKIPRLESALSPDSRLRFEREAKAAAALNHPNIVSVFETGSESGINYIVSELVEGENLATCLARGEQIPPRDAAKLVVSLADAVEHAHQRGVLHRDLKPSNILLPDADSTLPKITDFGLASIVDQQDFTQTGAVVGTPSYMSPEQASGNKNQLGPATDVYGLGTILYQLLTGRSPFGELPIVELIDAVNRRDPEPPRAINPTVPRDIESVCLKCLEKKTAHRYPSARELQADLQRFISGTPVVARQVTSFDRSIRWVKRNPVLATVGSSAILFLLVALSASYWGWSSTSAALVRESQAKNDARSTVDRYFTEVAENDLLDVPGLLPLRQELLTSALDYYQQYISTSSSDSDVLRELELAHFRVGKIQSDMGQYAEAIQSFENAILLQDQLLAAEMDNPDVQARKLDTLRHLGQSQIELSNYELGLATLNLAMEGQRQLVEANPNQTEWQYHLSRTLRAKLTAHGDQGEFPQAIEFGDEAIELLVGLTAGDPGNRTYLRDLAGCYLDQANAVAKTGDIDAAAASVDLAIQIFRSFVDSQNPTPKDFYALASALHNRAGKHLVKRESEPARPLLEEAATLNNHLVLMFPNAVEYRRLKLALLSGMGYCYSTLHLTDKVIVVLGDSIDTHKHMQREASGDPMIEYGLGTDQMNLGQTLAQQSDDQTEAINLLLDAEKNLAKFVQTSPNFFQGKMASAFCQKNLAAMSNQMGDHEAALVYADRSIEMLEAIDASKPGVPQIVQNIGGAYHNRADALEGLSRMAESIPVWRRAVESDGPFKTRSELRLAKALAQTGDLTEAIEILELLEAEPSTIQRLPGHLGRTQAAIASALSESADSDPAQIESLLDRSFLSIQSWFQKPENQKITALDKLRTNGDYVLLRQRDDFNQLIEEITQVLEAQ